MHRMLLLVVLGLAVATACTRKTHEDAATPAPGALELRSAPSAEVLVDGQVVGTTPLTHEVSPGRHEVVLRTPDFREVKKTFDVAPGVTHEGDWVLTPTDPGDPDAIRRLAEAFELEVVALEPVVRERGMRDQTRVVPCFPRGDVRLADLDEYRVEVGSDFEPDGSLKFQRGKQELHSAAFAPAALATTAPVPGSVQTALEPGAQVKWGYFPDKGKPVIASFKVVRDDPRLVKRLAKMQQRLAGQPDVVLHQMRAQLFLNKRLYMAAYAEARKAYDLSPDATQAVAIMQSALRRMRLDKTALWAEVQEAAAKAPPRTKGRAEDLRTRARS